MLLGEPAWSLQVASDSVKLREVRKSDDAIPVDLVVIEITVDHKVPQFISRQSRRPRLR